MVLDGHDLLRTPPYRIVRRGVARTFQNVVLFPTMTVTENVLVGAHTRMRPFGERRARGDALETLEYLGLTSLAARPAAGLPFGTLKRIELARALVSKPRLLLLDEPAGGLNHEEVEELKGLIGKLQKDFSLTDPARGAPHGARDVGLRSRARAQLRQQDRRGHTRPRCGRTRT